MTNLRVGQLTRGPPNALRCNRSRGRNLTMMASWWNFQGVQEESGKEMTTEATDRKVGVVVPRKERRKTMVKHRSGAKSLPSRKGCLEIYCSPSVMPKETTAELFLASKYSIKTIVVIEEVLTGFSSQSGSVHSCVPLEIRQFITDECYVVNPFRPLVCT